MKVKDLIKLLEKTDQDANVIILSQQRHPMEYSVKGILVRSSFDRDDYEGKKPNDILIVEDENLRNGNNRAWEMLS